MIPDPFQTTPAAKGQRNPMARQQKTKYSSAADITRRYIKEHPGRQCTAQDITDMYGHLLNPTIQNGQRSVVQQLSNMALAGQLARVGYGCYQIPGVATDQPEPEPQPQPEPPAHAPNGTVMPRQHHHNDHIAHPDSSPRQDAAVIPYQPTAARPHQPAPDFEALALASALADVLENLKVPYKYTRENGTVYIEWARP